VFAAALVIAVACRDATGPTAQRTPSDVSFGGKPGEEVPSRWRFTGGGRVDARDHNGYEKNTPESRDFATFGFQARPAGANTIAGSGNITWVEHNPDGIGGGFTFHGTVSFIMQPTAAESSPTSPDDCARFGGDGRVHARDGTTQDVTFVVEHACDVNEPGVGNDHIRIRISYGGYDRHGLLSGGNIQKHKI
jgi:hypothetical protein